MTDKMADGCVYPKAVKKLLGKYGFDVKYCTGNLSALWKMKGVCFGKLSGR